MTHEKLVSLNGGTKTYGHVQALRSVDFSLDRGEILAIVGKNGSGKSTLIKILSGVIQPDKGELIVGGETKHFQSPSDALHNGIVTVHQELSVIPSLTVAENIVLGNWPRKKGLTRAIDLGEMQKIARNVLEEIEEAQIDVKALVSSLSLAERQIVEIARALVQRPRILLLDEPFSTLSAHEVEVLSQKIKAIADTGLAVAFVTHRLGEVKDIATSVMVLRDGDLVIKERSDNITVEEVAQHMLGEGVDRPKHEIVRTDRISGDHDPILSLRNFSVPGKLDGIDLDIYPGEIVGIAGLLGAGRSEFLRGLLGLEPASFDQFTLSGKDIKEPDLKDMIKQGVYFVPEERKLEGFVGQFSVMENLELPKFPKLPFLSHLRWGDVRSSAQVIADRMSVKTSDLSEEITNLSGGNQQKVVLGRWIKLGDMKLFLLDEPTRGVDIHARIQIQAVIDDLAKQGVAVLMVASEFEELFDICDRLLLVSHGQPAQSIPIGETSLEAVTAQLLSA